MNAAKIIDYGSLAVFLCIVVCAFIFEAVAGWTMFTGLGFLGIAVVIFVLGNLYEFLVRFDFIGTYFDPSSVAAFSYVMIPLVIYGALFAAIGGGILWLVH